jgi:hypothetical protein
MAAETVKVRKVGGLDAVLVPGHKGVVRVGDEVELPKEQAEALVDGGEFEPAAKAAKKVEPDGPAKED